MEIHRYRACGTTKGHSFFARRTSYAVPMAPSSWKARSFSSERVGFFASADDAEEMPCLCPASTRISTPS